ncbi:glycogen/starch synthase [Flavobacteriales bacterium]|nr:glycogen/starch synthase [Flavobacteriales bacterium]
MNKETSIMAKKRILYVSQEITPYLPVNDLSKTARFLPQAMNESGIEVRLFMPRFGCINERRHQLHEVIRLSGMNLIVNDIDQPLIIKVASIPQARMQVYFIDNEEYFKRKFTTVDKKEKFYADNDERALFFCRGVIESVKKLGWSPDVIHCNGWMASFLPMYLNKFYHDDPIFEKTKIVYSFYNHTFEGKLNKDLGKKMKFDGFTDEEVSGFEAADHKKLMETAIKYSNAVVKGSAELSEDVKTMIDASKLPTLEFTDGEYKEQYKPFYESLFDD